MKSWLKDAKHVNDLGGVPHLKSNIPWEEEERREAVYWERWLAKLKKQIPVNEEYRPFFRSSMHDSWLVGSERKGGEYNLTVSCIFATVFAENLGDILGLHPEGLHWHFAGPFRVVLSCNDIYYQRTADLELNGWLKFYRIEIPEFKSFEQGTFLFDWFEEQDGRIQWVVNLWIKMENVFVLTDCKSLSATDLREVDLIKAFGPNVAKVWADVRMATERDWHYELVHSEIQKSMIVHGLTPKDFDTTNFRYSFREPYI
ncbi:hypothetical protein MCEMSE15_02594 [Fimbriimonadaceae bacterium]